mgnify:CR=1 FL=1
MKDHYRGIVNLLRTKAPDCLNTRTSRTWRSSMRFINHLAAGLSGTWKGNEIRNIQIEQYGGI